jgi:CheY-like chemotaxis protein
MARILVVDDDPLICSSVQAWLQNEGFEVVLADGGINGLSALDRASFDVAVVDIFMPDMNGFESIRAFNQHAPRTPTIATSGFLFSEHRGPAPDFLRMAAELGAAHSLRKPFKPRDLLTLIDQCLLRPGARLKDETTGC